MLKLSVVSFPVTYYSYSCQDEDKYEDQPPDGHVFFGKGEAALVFAPVSVEREGVEAGRDAVSVVGDGLEG